MFRSRNDDDFDTSRKNKIMLKQMSIYNNLLIYGILIHGHVSLSSRNRFMPDTNNEIIPQRVEFDISSDNTNIKLKRSFSMLENIERQYIFNWRDEFLQTAQIARWTSESEDQVLKSSIFTEYLYLVSGLNDVEDMMKAIFRFKYPAKDHVKYLNKLSNINKNNFLRIREFRD
ncbi:hypothetical protein DMUE_2872 [Dictyocoela muelleri]|nr:hypothetical protein DMUE_2872 [Dictyocoela muelleri]